MNRRPPQSAVLLRKAADLIEERGWCRGQYEDVAGRVCATGALVCAELNIGAGDLGQQIGLLCGTASAAYRTARYAVMDRLPDQTSIVGWNDNRLRTAQDVVRVFRDTADELEAQAG